MTPAEREKPAVQAAMAALGNVVEPGLARLTELAGALLTP